MSRIVPSDSHLSTANEPLRNCVEATWQLVRAKNLQFLELGDQALLFNPLSWETHLLSAPASALVSALLEGAKSTTVLLAEVGRFHSVQTQDVETLLTQMERLGLVQPATLPDNAKDSGS